MTERFTHRIGGQGLGGKVARGGDAALPVIGAIHGRTHTCDYFDVPGQSLPDRAAARGFGIVAVDQPGYGTSTPLLEVPEIIVTNAEAPNAALPGLLEVLAPGGRPVPFHRRGDCAGAGRQRLGQVLGRGGGVGRGGRDAARERGGPCPVPAPVFRRTARADEGCGHVRSRRQLRCGDAAGQPHRQCDGPAGQTAGHHRRLAGVAGAIAVPVHYRQGEHENLWLNPPERVTDFGRLFTASPPVDAAMVADAGHCIDFHLVGEAFQQSQPDFAASCAPQ